MPCAGASDLRTRRVCGRLSSWLVVGQLLGCGTAPPRRPVDVTVGDNRSCMEGAGHSLESRAARDLLTPTRATTVLDWTIREATRVCGPSSNWLLRIRCSSHEHLVVDGGHRHRDKYELAGDSPHLVPMTAAELRPSIRSE